MTEKDTVCFCNGIGCAQISAAIERGAHTLNSIYEATSAGVGPCGGTCRDSIQALISQTLSVSSTHPPAFLAPKWIPPIKLVEALSLFNRRYYWETHEILEELWLEERGRPKLFYQGIIQAAAALYHVLNANPRGVIKLAEDSIAKLNPYLPAYESIPLAALIESLGRYVEQSREILGSVRTGFNYDDLPTLVLGSSATPLASEPHKA